MKSLRGVGGKNRVDRMNRVKMVLNVCKAANVPLLTYSGKFKKWLTLVGECKARFRVPKGGPAAVPPETVAAVAAAGDVSLTEPLLSTTPEEAGYVPAPEAPSGAMVPYVAPAAPAPAAPAAPSAPPLEEGSYTPPPFVAFGRRSGFGYSDFGNFNFGNFNFGKKKYTGASPCKGMDQAACGGNPNCHYTKRGCASKKGTRSQGVVYEGPMGPPPGPPAFGRRKPPSALLKKCKKHGIKTTVKRGKHRVHRKTSILKKLLAKKMKKVKKVKKLSKSILSKCRKYRVKTTIKRGKHRVQKTLAVIKRQLRAKGCKRV